MSMRSENGFQFAHVDWSARTGAKKKTAHKNNGNSTRNKSWSAREIADEAERIDGACDHVENPQPPTLIYGMMPHQAVDQSEKWAESQGDTYQKKTKKGIVTIERGYRADAPVMAGGVVSFPREREAEWPAFRDESLRWLKNHYRERLLSVVEHLDERHPHLHFYAVPLPGEDFGAVHAGYGARQESRGKGEKAGETITAFKTAMKAWQDDFHSAVASKFELARFGPKRERKDRESALADRDRREIEAEKARLSDRQHEIAAAEKTLAETRANLNAGIKTFTEKTTIFKQVQKKFEADKSQWHTSGAKLGAIFSSARAALSGPDKEIEKLKAEKLEAEKRVSKAVKAEELRWSPALKEARDEARYQTMKREEAEVKRMAAEEALAALLAGGSSGGGGFDSGLSGPT